MSYLAAHSKADDLIEGTGGIRKLRWGRSGRGKRGGVWVIYYYHQRIDAALSANAVRQEQAGQFEQS